MANDTVKVGDYIIIQKQNYRKLHKLNKPNTSVTVGRDSINLSGIEGCLYSSVFRMISNSKKGREYRIELTNETVELKDEIDVKVSGTDNRNIIDDGRSQKLSHAEIETLANDANKASDIVETLISNSKTFHDKTEFSQEKYLKKKEKKYFEYLQVLRPNLRIISEVLYKLDPGKIQNLRLDTLSQIITLSNIQSDGNHLLYDSGSNGLVAAALLSAIGEKTNGRLVHMHPGNMSQKQALLAMNYNQEQLNRCISVNIYSALRQYYQGNSNNIKQNDNIVESSKSSSKNVSKEDLNINNTDKEVIDFSELNTLKRKALGSPKENGKCKISKLDITEDISIDGSSMKISNESDPKKPKWHYDNIAASELLNEKMDSLVIACKEDPENIFNELLQFIKPSRPFVIYYTTIEPLKSLYLTLRSNANVAALRLSCNWMRNYQILPERTHPEVTMNGQSGFLLTGYVLK